MVEWKCECVLISDSPRSQSFRFFFFSVCMCVCIYQGGSWFSLSELPVSRVHHLSVCRPVLIWWDPPTTGASPQKLTQLERESLKSLLAVALGKPPLMSKKQSLPASDTLFCRGSSLRFFDVRACREEDGEHSPTRLHRSRKEPLK